MDLAGRIVFQVKNESMETGNQVIEWKTTDLPEGLYLVGLKKDAQGWLYQKVLLVR
jgi:hypothetical protein